MQAVLQHLYRLYAKFRTDGWWVLWALLGIGLLLRIAAMVFYTPSIFNYYGGDSARYMRLDVSGVTGLFGDVAMPAGYPAFLAVLRSVHSWLPFTTMVQHLLGLATALLLYAAVRAVGTPRWAALLPAVVVIFSGDQIFIEHGILTEALWIPLLALGMYLMARSISAPVEKIDRWLVAGGVVLACSALVRNLSEMLPILLALWAIVALPGSAGTRVRHVAALLLPAVAVIAVYTAVAKPISDGYSGLGENSGFSLYSRVAQFADCDEFTPPSGTEQLCVDIPPSERRGPFYWAWSPASPLRSKFEFDIHDEEDQERLSSFARAAIVHQPLAFALTAGRDFSRFFVPDAGTPRPDSGAGEDQMSFASTIPTAQGASLAELAEQYDDAYTGVGDGTASEASRTVLGAYQSLFRVDGRLMLLLMILGFVGCLTGGRATRAGAALFLLSGLALLAIPPLVSSYDIRYSLPPIDLFAASAAFGLAALGARVTQWSSR